MQKLALESGRKMGMKKKFKVILIDPPYDKTGCKLPYNTLKNNQWMETIDFDALQDDGIVLIWVVTSSQYDVETYGARSTAMETR